MAESQEEKLETGKKKVIKKIIRKVVRKKKVDVKAESESESEHDDKSDSEHDDKSGSDVSSVSTVSVHKNEQERTEDVEDQIGVGVGTASITIDRDEYLAAHRELTHDRNHAQVLNNLLHRRLAEYYKKRKCEHVLKTLEGAHDLEEKYQQKLFAFQELKEKAERETAEIQAKLEEVEAKYVEKLEHANTKFDELQNLESSTGVGLIYSGKGKPMPDKTVQRFLTLQRRKSEQATALSRRYIRVRNAVSDLEAVVKQLETLGPGLYVYQYEQLHVDNQNYATKIEEREDELIKNRAKCTEHNQILAHIREKMHHTDEVIDFAECDLGDAEMEFTRAREDLGTIKSRRNKLRWSLEEERLKAGLLTRKDLLRDFQASVDEVAQLEQRKKYLESQVFKNTNNLRVARKSVQFHGNVIQRKEANMPTASSPKF